jgi:hypothetical protein
MTTHAAYAMLYCVRLCYGIVGVHTSGFQGVQRGEVDLLYVMIGDGGGGGGCRICDAGGVSSGWR